ncbi:MAG: hypothetical protein KFF72_13815 [Arthrospira sp. SH-MAG29]|nr:hypothetical protein [Arthrospira sp. SH-MAG29]MBS0017403.1 hypothetical protein [Arthrospira sp. SH-MAG29]
MPLAVKTSSRVNSHWEKVGKKCDRLPKLTIAETGFLYQVSIGMQRLS